MDRFAGGCTKHLVVTGGEPLRQQRQLLPLLKDLKAEGFCVELETNGTITPAGNIIPLVDCWNVSPKLENSGDPRHRREVPACLTSFAAMPASHFKFVVQGEADLEEVERMVHEYHLPADRVILMPEAANAADLMGRSGWLVEACVSRGYLFSTRLHVLLWGNRRGV